MGLAEDDRPFPQETMILPYDDKDGKSMSSKEPSFSKEDNEDAISESQQFLNSISFSTLNQEDRPEFVETFAGNRAGFSDRNCEYIANIIISRSQYLIKSADKELNQRGNT